MTYACDRGYLHNPYGDATNLDARVALDQLYSTHPQDWHAWVYEQFDLPPEARILELGCGPGHLWRSNLERLPDGWRIVLSDRSRGMVRTARRAGTHERRHGHRRDPILGHSWSHCVRSTHAICCVSPLVQHTQVPQPVRVQTIHGHPLARPLPLLPVPGHQ